jgi:hypothetical protein
VTKGASKASSGASAAQGRVLGKACRARVQTRTQRCLLQKLSLPASQPQPHLDESPFLVHQKLLLL